MQNLQVINTETGEIIPQCEIRTPQQITATQRQIDKKRMEQHMLSVTGNFCFYFFTNCQLAGLDNATITRLIMASTYCNYNGILCHDNGRIITQDGLQQILHLKDRVFFNFVAKCKTAGILSYDGQQYKLDRDVFAKGNLKKKDYQQDFTKIYAEGIRNIYNSVSVASHKTLGYLFAILPYINRDYNFLCKNQDENNLDNLSYLTLGEVAAMFGYDVTHIGRLKSDLWHIRFDNGELCVNFVPHPDLALWCVIVNPRLYYMGSNPIEMQKIGNIFFKNKEKDSTRQNVQ